MASTDSISGMGGPVSTAGTSRPGTLGKDDFLQLLVAQLQHQDPLSPMNDKDFMAQMAQFSTLEQITNVGQQMQGLAFATQVTQAMSLVGRTVTFGREDGTTGQGTASSVAFEDGKIFITVNGEEISPAAIQSVS